ncbi:MAG: TetR/AcrR family transcriptional regulator [Chloroflexi bacterium]|nr:TetR/AcrR family transcriptional regulator [Chloroflexota bacterium]
MRQAERRAKTLATLLESATIAFAGRGYEGTSIDAVAAAAGLSKGAVYAHFETKLDLFLAVLDRALADAERRLEGPAAAIGEPLATAADRFFAGGDPDLLTRITTEAWRLALTTPAVRDRLSRFRTEMVARLAHSGVDAGLAPAEALTRAGLVTKLIDGLMVERQLERAIGA